MQRARVRHVMSARIHTHAAHRLSLTHSLTHTLTHTLVHITHACKQNTYVSVHSGYKQTRRVADMRNASFCAMYPREMRALGISGTSINWRADVVRRAMASSTSYRSWSRVFVYVVRMLLPMACPIASCAFYALAMDWLKKKKGRCSFTTITFRCRWRLLTCCHNHIVFFKTESHGVLLAFP